MGTREQHVQAMGANDGLAFEEPVVHTSKTVRVIIKNLKSPKAEVSGGALGAGRSTQGLSRSLVMLVCPHAPSFFVGDSSPFSERPYPAHHWAEVQLISLYDIPGCEGATPLVSPSCPSWLSSLCSWFLPQDSLQFSSPTAVRGQDLLFP